MSFLAFRLKTDNLLTFKELYRFFGLIIASVKII